MRSLATCNYTDAQVQAALRTPSTRDGARFDVLDRNLNIVGALTTVEKAVVQHDVDRKIKGSLSLTMQADASMIGRWLTRLIRPWYRVGMPDGGVAEIPMGVYVWTRPNRSRDNAGSSADEPWSIVMGDQLHLLDLSGPGVTGFLATANTPVTTALGALLARVGITDVSGMAAIDAKLPVNSLWSTQSPQVWSYADRRPVSLLDIAAQLHNGAGVYGPWFDMNGRYRVLQVPDLSTAQPSITYATSVDSIVGGFDTDQDLDKFANRSTARTSGGTNGFIGEYVADADLLYPSHPANHANTGIYVDLPPIDTTIATTLADLRKMAEADLHQRISFDLSIRIPTAINPAHEAFDVVGTQWDGDSEFGATTRFHERQWTIELPCNPDGGDVKPPMDHKLNRLYG